MVLCCCAYGCNETFVKRGPVTFHSFPKDADRRRLWELKVRRANFQATNHSRICSKHFTSDCFDTKRFGGTWLKPNAVPTVFSFSSNNLQETSQEMTSGDISKIAENCQIEGEAILGLNEEKFGEMWLKPDAVPTVFSFSPNNLQETSQELSSEDVSEIAEDEDVDGQFEGEAMLGLNEDFTKRSHETPEASRKRLHYLGDFHESDITSPEIAKQILHIAQEQMSAMRLKIKNLNRKNRRLKTRIAKLQNKKTTLNASILKDL